ncbi:MAG: ABC transporter permease, partial [Desulfobacterales bacterium]|nr:ABC transporter permease [Desulfobacterales bacterium]
MREFIRILGSITLNFLTETGRVMLLLLYTLRQLVTPPYDLKLMIKQMMEVGVRSVPVVLVTALFTGMVLALQTYTGFQRFGAESVVG